MKSLEKICYLIAICCIAGAVVLSLMLIWSAFEPEYLWKGLLSLCVFFFASAAILVVNNTVGRRDQS